MIEKPHIKVPVVAGVVLYQDGKFLLVQEKQPKAFMKWNWPAGKVDEGESLEQAAIREAREESGFEVRVGRELGIWQQTADSAVGHAYQATIVGGKLDFPKDEIMDARWFTLEEIQGMASSLRGPWVLEAAERVIQES